MSGKPLAQKRCNSFLSSGGDIQLFGVLLMIAGTFDAFWIAAYPNYALKIFGTTFSGWVGEFVKYQHPIIHWVLGYGFWRKSYWAFWCYLLYLGLGCLSEFTTQIIDGYHSTRTTMIVISMVFGIYVFLRYPVFLSPTGSSSSSSLD